MSTSAEHPAEEIQTCNNRIFDLQTFILNHEKLINLVLYPIAQKARDTKDSTEACKNAAGAFLRLFKDQMTALESKNNEHSSEDVYQMLKKDPDPKKVALLEKRMINLLRDYTTQLCSILGPADPEKIKNLKENEGFFKWYISFELGDDTVNSMTKMKEWCDKRHLPDGKIPQVPQTTSNFRVPVGLMSEW